MTFFKLTFSNCCQRLLSEYRTDEVSVRSSIGLLLKLGRDTVDGYISLETVETKSLDFLDLRLGSVGITQIGNLLADETFRAYNTESRKCFTFL